MKLLKSVKTTVLLTVFILYMALMEVNKKKGAVVARLFIFTSAFVIF